MTYTWKILELFANNGQLISVRYLVSANEETQSWINNSIGQ